MWQLTDGGWIHVSNIKGPQGQVGPQGPQGPQGEQGVSIVNVTTKSFCDADDNVYMEITFHYSNDTTSTERVYLGHTIYVGSEMTLEKALEVVAEGGEIMLTTDIELDKQITVNKKVEINLAGNTISNTTDIWNEADGKWSLISVSGDGELIITDSTSEGKLEAKENDCYAIAVRDGGKCVIEGGIFEGNVSAVYVKEGELQIKGGTFLIKQLSAHGDERFTINCLDENYVNGTAKVIIEGGSFYNFDPANNLSEGSFTKYIADGYAIEIDGNWYTVGQMY